MDQIYYVYFLIDPRNMKTFYVGKGKDNRCYRHLWPSFLSKNTPKNALIHEILASNLEVIIVKDTEGLTEEAALKLEQQWIEYIGKENLTNLTTGGQGVSGLPGAFLGKHHTEESKTKIRESKMGANNPMYGKKRSASALAKFSAKMRGDKHPMYGKHHPEEIREKIRQTLTGIELTEKQKQMRKESMKRVWSERKAAGITYVGNVFKEDGSMDIRSGGSYPSAQLSNFYPNKFIFDGVECGSMEGFVQAIKYANPDMQKEICKLVGKAAKQRTRGKKWFRTQVLYWMGQEYPRNSPGYQNLLDRAYRAMFEQNEHFRKALKASGNSTLTHTIGKTKESETVLTRQEFCSRLMALRAELS